ncbi:MAG TPA: response regulator [Methanocorpusculum sp.]|nr:response regulator [Methanocorpusculum sp.]
MTEKTDVKNKKRILVIDDDALTRVLAESALQSEYEVLSAASVKEAAALIRVLSLSLILLDINLPGTDGLSFLSRLKDLPETKTIPVILITGETDSQYEETGLLSGAEDYIRKPFSPSVLRIRVEKALAAAKLKQSKEPRRVCEKRSDTESERELKNAVLAYLKTQLGANACTYLKSRTLADALHISPHAAARHLQRLSFEPDTGITVSVWSSSNAAVWKIEQSTADSDIKDFV